MARSGRAAAAPHLLTWVWAAAWAVWGVRGSPQVGPCTFNHLCTCSYSSDAPTAAYTYSSAPPTPDLITELTCVGVPFARIPDIPPGLVMQMDVLNSGLEVIAEEDFGDTRVSNLRLMSNNIRLIADKAFSGMSQFLQSLDLSHNELTSVPRGALSPLNILEWFNLHGNHIAELAEEDWLGLRDTLATLFLGDNDIDHVPRDVFSRCKRLLRLNLDDNNILTLERDSLSRNIQTLSLSHNLLTGFPSEALSNIRSLTWLFLRGNLLDRLPDTGFVVQKKLDKLDLGENFIRFIPNNLFNGSLTVRDLHLDFNLLTEIQERAFQGLNPGRLYLSSNNIFNISEEAFLGGPENSLVMVDLEKNSLSVVPKALSRLKRLRYLYLPDNKISEIKDDAFCSFCETLESLSLSGNQLKAVPRNSLENCSTITHLNLGHNQIEDLREEDFETWGDNLETLVLRNNKIQRILPHTFRYTPKLRELSLSFNRIGDITAESFIDVLNTLEVLEISFGFYRDDFPEEVLKPLTALQWIALDNNNFRTISETALYSFGELHYFNMDSNRLTHIPKTLFHQNVHKKLSDIRLALNFIDRLETHTFHHLVNLRTLVLTGNKIRTVHFEAFKNLPVLSTILLSDNQLEHIEPRAFSDLPGLVELDLQQNRLKEFSLAVFANVTTSVTPLDVNISYNDIHELSAASGPHPQVMSLDVSHNALKEVPINFLGAIVFSLQRLDLGYNKITKLDSTAFGHLPRLQMLILVHNGIKQVRPRAFSSLKMVQLLDLSHNHVKNLPQNCFSDTSFLRVLDLSFNHLRSLPLSVFRGTRLEKLQLSHNQFVSMPVTIFKDVEESLHYLDISHNHLEHLDSTMFYNAPNLIELNLAHNRLSILPDNVFLSLTGLITLDLSFNPVRANFKELFHYTQNIQKLNMAGIGFTSSPIIPLPNLISLNLSSNGITEVEQQSVETLTRLRSLDLSRNQIVQVRSRLWRSMVYLKYLDLSYNPIESLTKDSFGGASNIETLVLSNLDNITRFDYDALSHMTFLRELYMNTFPHIEKYRFRVGHLLATVHTLQKLHLEVREKALTDQITGAFGPKLKELHITGKALIEIDSNTFKGFQNKHELLLSITDTSIESFPDGLLAHLSDVAYLSLDLRRNLLKYLSPQVLYENSSTWESKGTTFVAGGLALEDNEWSCDCSLVWLGRWLRRWLRETLLIHTAVLKGAQRVHTLARAATCYERRTGQNVPLLDLHAEDLGCQASALSDASDAPPVSSPLHLVILSLITLVVVGA
ncbi:chaoptin-like [Portunus trituberculatus]|uniref:chaoptin-like n=1 Tax=Portunus trituberculatus TaxID=210409 RepID=UPI001E1D1354|nr:chaoptin-like [Portunus trituberculatus]XP_045122789.1 chaoptin-like [Portunus trituberculatus]XP_045122790.1 chaoptin-like [Portunus trituberculatus]XP_045122791.1 chaoptin-like [Portunus trituberculatus]XP_045122792.1 chaoptin-like [Portunus trituberculatus]